MNEQEKTLMQTIRARLEWTKEGTVKAFPDIHGSWFIADMPSKTNSSLVGYFTPHYQIGYDPYGNPIKPEQP